MLGLDAFRTTDLTIPIIYWFYVAHIDTPANNYNCFRP
jgi:hypothetical protein